MGMERVRKGLRDAIKYARKVDVGSVRICLGNARKYTEDLGIDFDEMYGRRSEIIWRTTLKKGVRNTGRVQ